MKELFEKGKDSFYAKYTKRGLDIVCATAAMTVFAPLYACIALAVRVELGSPVIFKQPRPGKDEKIFTLYKFRTMTDEKEESGNLKPDDERLTEFGKKLRSTSLDELPEAWNILKGDMSVVGPRPQLVRDMVFMTDEQRRRHDVRPGLSGWAQVNGRNCIEWEGKLKYDLEYLNDISFEKDFKIVCLTVGKFLKMEDISQEGMETAEDLGDYLLRTSKIEKVRYDELKQQGNLLIAIAKGV